MGSNKLRENSSTGDERKWIRLRPSFREGISRGSQTTTDDIADADESSEEERRPIDNVRRASFLLGDLRAIYHNDQKTENSDRFSLRPEPRNSLAYASTWGILFHDTVLPELEIVCHSRYVHRDKCLVLTQKRSRKILIACFSAWRQSILRALKSDLIASIEKNDTAFYRQRKRNVMKVWSHIALGLNSRRKIIERRHGGIDRARDSLASRLLEQNESQGLITRDMIEVEIRRMVNAQMTAWASRYHKRAYFKMWRDHFLSYKDKLLLSKANVGHGDICNIAEDNSNYEKAGLFYRKQMNKKFLILFQRWRRYSKAITNSKRMRRRILSHFARACLIAWKTLKVRNMKIRWNAVLQWLDIDKSYYRLPFEKWREAVGAQKIALQIQDKLVSVYLRSKNRRKLGSFFRRWKHQSKYGRVIALHTRTQLAAGWMEQKRIGETLNLRIENITSKVAEYDKLKGRVEELEEKLRQSEAERKNTERVMSQLKDKNETLTRLSPFAENLEVLYPLFMHNNNMI